MPAGKAATVGKVDEDITMEEHLNIQQVGLQSEIFLFTLPTPYMLLRQYKITQLLSVRVIAVSFKWSMRIMPSTDTCQKLYIQSYGLYAIVRLYNLALFG